MASINRDMAHDYRHDFGVSARNLSRRARLYSFVGRFLNSAGIMPLSFSLPKTENQRAERHAEGCVNRLGLRRRIVGQEFNSDIGITHWNDTGLLHAQDSQVDLSLTETAGKHR